MSDRKFTTLRKRLDQLGYRQPLVIEAIPLVEKLFSDLVHTTENFKNYKNKLIKNDRELLATDVSEPYRNDNAKLIRENNELHTELIRCKEENENSVAELKSSVRKLENENQDLKFLNSQYVHKIKRLEKESKQKSDHIQNLQEKNMHAVIETPGGRKKNIPFRRQRMDLESTLRPNTVSLNTTQSSDPYVADLLGIADARTEELKQKLDVFEDVKKELERKLKNIKKQVETRDKEIDRLKNMLNGGRPIEAVFTDNHRSSSDRVVAHLNMQVDYLQQANRDLEKQLAQNQASQAESVSMAKQLQERNEELCMELAAMDKICKNIEKEKRRGDDEVDNQLIALQKQVEGKHQVILELEATNYSLKKERDELIEETGQLSSGIKAAQDDKQNIAALFERAEKEKRRLSEKNAKLTISGRELAMELERLKVSKGVLPKKSHKSPNNIELLIRNLEDDRDHYKHECDALQKMIHKRLSSNVELNSSEKMHENNAMLKLMTEERDYYKNELEHSSRFFERDGRVTSKSKEVSQLKRERDELQKVLQTFESHLAKIQENVRVVTTDRDNIQLLYEQSTEEIQRLRRQMARARSPPNTSRKVTEILDKAEKERDEALAELRKARVDIQSLRSDIKATQESHQTDRQLQNAKQRDVEDVLSKMETHNNTLNTRMTSTQSMIHTLEDQLFAANQSVQRTNEEVMQKEAELSKLRVLVERSDRNCDELKRKLEEKTIELEQRDDENIKIEDKYELLERKLLEYKNEVVRLKGIVSSLDHERDTLLQQVDDKTEQLVTLDDGLRKQEKADQELKFSFEELEENLRYKEQELSSKDREIISLSKQLRSLEEELAAVAKSRDATIKENKRIQDDLAVMTEENQIVHKNLQESLDESHNLKQQIEEYILQLTRIQDLLSEKEIEKEDLLLQYKTLSNKADILETNMQQSEDDAETFRQDVLHLQKEVNYLQDRCAAFQSEVEQHISTEESYESQMAALTKSLANLESQLGICSEEKETILQDLFAVRELCVKLDQTREELTRKIAAKSTDNENMEQRLNETKAETEVYRKQVLQEKENIKSLENIISTSREKQFFEKRTHEEEMLDLEQLKRDLDQSDRIRKQIELENDNLRKQSIALQQDVTSLQKQLTTEKFERERLKQELRRKSHSPMPDLHKTSKSTENMHATETKIVTTATASNLRGSNSSYLSSRKHLSPPTSPVRMGTSGAFSPLQVSFSSDGTES